MHSPGDADLVRGHCAKIVGAGMLREAGRTVIQDCLEPLPVAIRECRTRLRADADAKKIERSVEVGFAVDGKRLPLRETLKMASPFPIVLCVPLESLVHILVARSGQHWSLRRVDQLRRSAAGPFCSWSLGDNREIQPPGLATQPH